MDGQDIPSPLPFVVSILPLLLSSSDVTLPPATLSTSVLQRHYYLSSSSDSPSSYLQATSDAPIQDAVETRRERLASTWLEDVKPSEILYSATIHEEQKLVARIKLSVASSTSDNDDGSLVLLVVYEEAASPPDEESGSSGVSAAAGSSTAKEEEEEESGWKYYDLQLPQSRLNMNTSAWQTSIPDAKAALARQIPSTSTDTRAHRSSSVSTTATTTNKKSQTNAAQKALREKQREADAAKGLGVEEGPDQDPDDYWAGCESSDDEGGNRSEIVENELEEDNEDDYWNNYGQSSPGNSGSIVDSGHHEHDQPLEEDHTLRYDHDNSGSVGHFEYARDAPSNLEEPRHTDYSFDSERNEEIMPVTNGRILVDERDSRTTNQDFLSTLQYSLERVSSSQSEGSHSDNDMHDGAANAAIPINGQMNGNGHAHPERPTSPTIDSAISKSIAGLWETYLLSSALGGGGKSREIAAYEFMELVQTVVLGEPS